MFSTFAHIPGLKVILPATPKDAKGMLIAAIRDDGPVLVFEHRWLYWQKGEVPEEPYAIPLTSQQVLKQGKDITLVALSWMNAEAKRAADILERKGISVETIDARVLAPFDETVIVNSVKKTGRCIIADNDWVDFGASAEIATRIYNTCYPLLKAPIKRLGFAHTPCPTARHLENEFYPNAKRIIRLIEQELEMEPMDLSKEDFYSHENKFKGPF